MKYVVKGTMSLGQAVPANFEADITAKDAAEASAIAQAQGMEVESVVTFEERRAARLERERWLYAELETALGRKPTPEEVRLELVRFHPPVG